MNLANLDQMCPIEVVHTQSSIATRANQPFDLLVSLFGPILEKGPKGCWAHSLGRHVRMRHSFTGENCVICFHPTARARVRLVLCDLLGTKTTESVVVPLFTRKNQEKGYVCYFRVFFVLQFASH